MAPTEAPTNPRLVRALADAREASELELDNQLRPLLQELVTCTLVTGKGPEPSTVETEDDESFLALFTDLIELHFFEPGSKWSAMTAEEAIKQVARGDYDGLVINPGPRQFELSREDVCDFFDVDP